MIIMLCISFAFADKDTEITITDSDSMSMGNQTTVTVTTSNIDEIVKLLEEITGAKVKVVKYPDNMKKISVTFETDVKEKKITVRSSKGKADRTSGVVVVDTARGSSDASAATRTEIESEMHEDGKFKGRMKYKSVGLEKQVSFTFEKVPLRTVIQWLSDASGYKLSLDNISGNQLVTVEADRVKIIDALKSIAKINNWKLIKNSETSYTLKKN